MHATSRDRRRQHEDGSAIGYKVDDSSVHNEAQGAQIVFGGNPWVVIISLVLGSLGFLMGAIALMNSSKVAEFAFIAGEAKSKAETATARANVSEIYAKQLFTEMNRLGYPIKTPLEQHAPQPSDNVVADPATLLPGASR